MKNHAFIVLILLMGLAHAAVGQKYRLGVKFLPGLTDDHDPYEKQNFQNRIKPRFTFNAGADFIFGVKDSLLFIETGIYFIDRGNVQKDFVSVFDTLQDNGKYTRTSDIYLHRCYLSIPLLFRVEYKGFYFSLGPTIAYYLTSVYVWTGENKAVDKMRWTKGILKDIEFDFDVNIGKQFRVCKRIDLFVEAGFNPGEFHRDPVNKKLYYNLTYELGTGLTYKL
jgi:hypothetical protein